MTQLGFTRDLDVPWQDAVTQVTAALKEQGFGILTRIDVHDVLKEKLDADLPPYVILGACNPELAREAIGHAPEVGLLLPCNVLLEARPDGGTRVSFANPVVMGDLTGQAAMQPLMSEAEGRLRTALVAMA